jgi:hypothetical protein
MSRLIGVLGSSQCDPVETHFFFARFLLDPLRFPDSEARGYRLKDFPWEVPRGRIEVVHHV